METDIKWMQRAMQLAEFGRGSVSPNPMVGCVIVCEDRIIGEGWHRQYGGPHAEVRAIEDAEQKRNGHLLPDSTAYVTLEPCSHTGKTPPCADLLIRKKLKKVVVCNLDPNPLVAGRGIKKLIAAGIQVETGILEKEGLELNKRFFTAMQKQRPYVILKWAETADGFIGKKGGPPVPISGALSNMRVHKWRAEEDAILVGFKTALADNPRLNVRNWSGRNPVRIVLDRYLQLLDSLHLFDGTQATIVVNYLEETLLPTDPERYAGVDQVAYLKVDAEQEQISQLLAGLFQRKIHSVFVEGGTTVINAFLQSGLWDEIRRCQGTIEIGEGVDAPVAEGTLVKTGKVEADLWSYYLNR
jgi:diaminohydroxyphosphoribosylaminopyrimidine deaminase/5-amino-6-(5-phosphoribosylamino)uracil reductase